MLKVRLRGVIGGDSVEGCAGRRRADVGGGPGVIIFQHQMRLRR